MLLDLLSADNYSSYNIKIANILGLNAAVYLNELLNINGKAVRKSKTRDNIIVIDRKYIEKRTTLTRAMQLELDKGFIDINLLKYTAEDQDSIEIDMDVLISLVGANKATIKDIKSILGSRKSSKKTKAEATKEYLKGLVVSTNIELYNAYCDWIDAVYAKEGWMTPAAVQTAQVEIDKASKRNLDVALEILKIAAINGHRDITWSIENYARRNVVPTLTIPTPTINANRPRKVDDLDEEVF